MSKSFRDYQGTASPGPTDIRMDHGCGAVEGAGSDLKSLWSSFSSTFLRNSSFEERFHTAGCRRFSWASWLKFGQYLCQIRHSLSTRSSLVQLGRRPMKLSASIGTYVTNKRATGLLFNKGEENLAAFHRYVGDLHLEQITNKKGQDMNPGTESLPFTFGVVGQGQEGVDPALASPGDYLVFATGLIPVVGVVAGLVDLFGTAGITAHPQLWLALNDAPLTTGTPPLFGTSPQTFLKLVTNATHRQWMGTWGTGEISVTITQPAGGATLSAAVYDGTTKPALSFTETITPGPAGLMAGAAGWVHTLVQEQAQSPEQRVALTNAATQVINEAAQAQAAHSPVQTRGLPTHFRSLVGAQHTETATAATAAVGGALAKILEAEGAIAYLKNNVVLSLYGVFEANGTQIGTQLQYQRFTTPAVPCRAPC
jgi:hypothetical protein